MLYRIRIIKKDDDERTDDPILRRGITDCDPEGHRDDVRKYIIPQPMTVEYLLGDHLGSTSITTDAAGVKTSEIRYKPWCEVRYSWVKPDLNTTPAYELTKYTFTGQRSEMTAIGLMFYNARWYDSQLKLSKKSFQKIISEKWDKTIKKPCFCASGGTLMIFMTPF